jgi:nitrile hydratase accessory protein
VALPPSVEELKQVPAIPLDDDGAVFNAPWEAKAFAMVVSLHQQGHFSWTEWAETIAAEIERDRGSDPETPYYELWLRAAEKIIDAKGLCTTGELRATAAVLSAQHAAPHDHDHAEHDGHGHTH